MISSDATPANSIPAAGAPAEINPDDPPPRIRAHDVPFAFFHCAPVLSAADCQALGRLFVGDHVWQHRSKGGYACALREVTDEVSDALKTAVLADVRTMTGVALTDRVQITAQEMGPGQDVSEHSDHPQLGYEIARMIVYLNHDWQPGDGGLLELLDGPSGRATAVAPRYNHGFAFLLHAASLHRVSPVRRRRWSVVFNFWHPANSPALADAVAALLADMHFSELPAAMDPWVAPIEALLDEDVSFRANVAAVILHRWGFSAEVATVGYYASAGHSWRDAGTPEAAAAVLLATWIATLRQGIFDRDAWRIVAATAHAYTPPAQLETMWSRCFPRL